MCLIIKDKNNFKPKIAEEDIVCYKFMQKGSKSFLFFGDRSYLSPVYPEKWKLNELHTSRLYCSYEDDLSWGVVSYNVVVSHGLHTFKDFNGVVNYMKFMLPEMRSKYTICKAIIPKGSLYYEGVSQESVIPYIQYASNQLILTSAGVDYVS